MVYIVKDNFYPLLRPDKVDSQFIVGDILKSHVGRRSFFIFHYVIYHVIFPLEYS